MDRSMAIRNFMTVLLLATFLLGCSDKTTYDPVEVYKLWSGKRPSAQLKIVHGKYWESAHWSKEYILFLEMKASKEWVNAFANQNTLVIDTIRNEIADAPAWFKPARGFLVFRRKDDLYGSRYYFNLKEDRVFIFEAQL